MIVQSVVDVLESWAPPALAASYDNVGLLVGNPQMDVRGVLVNLDMTEEVVAEAVASGCNLIVGHHPIWFTARKRLNGEDYVSRTIIAAIKQDVALYACHTNLDSVRTGVNARISERLGLGDTDFLRPTALEVDAGSGMIGYLPRPMPKKDFLTFVKRQFHCGGIRFADAPIDAVQKVAVCGGAGSFLTADALRLQADAFVTADITYHKFFDHEQRMLLLDIGHYESEQFTSELIVEYLLEKFPTFDVRLSKVNTNPVTYFA